MDYHPPLYECAPMLGLRRNHTDLPALSEKDREVALSAAATKVVGDPAGAVIQMMVAVAILNGERGPVLAWPINMPFEEKAAWHEAEAAKWRAIAKRESDSMPMQSRSADQGPQNHREKTGSLSPVETPHHSTSIPQVLCEGQAESLPPCRSGEPDQEPNDVC